MAEKEQNTQQTQETGSSEKGAFSAGVSSHSHKNFSLTILCVFSIIVL